MKKTFLYGLAFLGIILFANIGNSFAQDNHTWTKSETGIWKGKRDTKIVSYKTDIDYIVYVSADEKKWEPVVGNTWTDFEGNVYKEASKMLFISKDNGVTWDNAHGATWHGGDGLWYKLDESWGLWVSQQ